MFFVAVIVVLVFRPGGLFGKREETEDKVAFVPPIRELPARYRLSDISVWFGRYWAFTAVAFAVAISLVVPGRRTRSSSTSSSTPWSACRLTVLMGYTGQISLGHWALVGVGAFAVANLFSESGWPFPVTIAAVVVDRHGGEPPARAARAAHPGALPRGRHARVPPRRRALPVQEAVDRRAHGRHHRRRAEDRPVRPRRHRPPAAVPLRPRRCCCRCGWPATSSATRTGRSFFALRENEKAAATLGVPLARYRVLAFAVSGGIAALAGVVHVLEPGIVTAVEYRRRSRSSSSPW